MLCLSNINIWCVEGGKDFFTTLKTIGVLYVHGYLLISPKKHKNIRNSLIKTGAQTC